MSGRAQERRARGGCARTPPTALAPLRRLGSRPRAPRPKGPHPRCSGPVRALTHCASANPLLARPQARTACSTATRRRAVPVRRATRRAAARRATATAGSISRGGGSIAALRRRGGTSGLSGRGALRQATLAAQRSGLSGLPGRRLEAVSVRDGTLV